MIWRKCLKRLESELTINDINIWLKPLQVIEENTSLTIVAPNDIIIDKINADYLSLIKLAIKDISNLNYTISVSLPQQSNILVEKPNISIDQPIVPLPSNIDSRYTFDTFVEGRSNAIAKASSLQVAQQPL
ncbi:MAG: hypothetical protein JKX98_00915, partial [Alcanivoracaceae bacterium]|nr:hypothetical protein [Alcanivoracaceae bacterium]